MKSKRLAHLLILAAAAARILGLTWVGVAAYGLELRSEAKDPVGWRGFASRESVSPASPPRLAITYRP